MSSGCTVASSGVYIKNNDVIGAMVETQNRAIYAASSFKLDLSV